MIHVLERSLQSYCLGHWFPLLLIYISGFFTILELILYRKIKTSILGVLHRQYTSPTGFLYSMKASKHTPISKLSYTRSCFNYKRFYLYSWYRNKIQIRLKKTLFSCNFAKSIRYSQVDICENDTLLCTLSLPTTYWPGLLDTHRTLKYLWHC